MAFSVNTNEGALAALRNLTATNTNLEITQNRINTGLEIASARDGAAFFNIAQGLRADVAGLSAVNGSLNRASSVLDVALAAGEAISDLLVEIRGLAVASRDTGLDTSSRQALNQEFLQLQAQIGTIAESASFNGTNALTNSNDIVAIVSDDGATTISTAALNFTLAGLNLSGATISTQASAATLVSTLSVAQLTVNNGLAQLGAFGTRLDIQQVFNTRLTDAIEVGIGDLVDADLAVASADLQALQVQQQLGLQALSIANSSPQSILGLFN